MEIITLINTVYNKNQYERVINTSFSQLVQPQITSSLPTITVAEFFQNYQELFFSIPKFGDTNSHEYLIKTSTEYIGSALINADIQALIEEINNLQQTNLELNQQLIDTNKEISNTMNESYGSYVKNLDKSKEQEDALLQNYNVLEQEKQEIDKLVRQFQTLNSAQENGEVNVTMYYYHYIILLLIVILLCFLFIKFTVSSEQFGGGNNYNIYKI